MKQWHVFNVPALQEGANAGFEHQGNLSKTTSLIAITGLKIILSRCKICLLLCMVCRMRVTADKKSQIKIQILKEPVTFDRSSRSSKSV